MRVLVAGASGAVGRHLLPKLVAAGWSVVATTRTAKNASRIAELGAEPVVLDGLDRAATLATVARARPDAVVDELTSLAKAGSYRRFDRAFEMTNRLRTTGLDYLLEAAKAAGARRFVAQSFAGWPYAPVGGPVKSETDPLDPSPLPSMRRSLSAIVHLESALASATGIETLALRFGSLYGPDTSIAPGGDVVRAVDERKLPLIGSGAGVWSFLHIDDAASATVAAISRGGPGVYNIVDDEPARASVWLPELARIRGAPLPRRVPAWLARPLAGAAVVYMMTKERGASNAKAKAELGWRPAYPTWRTGFREVLAR